ncbi:hypothetical protein [Luteitalea sp.]
MTLLRYGFSLTTALALLVSATSIARSATPDVRVVRVPDGGVQPDVAVDASGVLHLVYLAGPPGSADVFYTFSRDGGRTFAPRVRVNSQPGSAIAMGTIRGAQLALAREGRLHVVWNGSNTADPKPPVRHGQKPGMPLLYARSAAGRAAFKPQRNLMTATRHLDGGSSVAADDVGNVLVAWHANALDGAEGEQARRVWLARSADDGATFSPEVAISPAETGACGCCGLRIAASGRNVHVLYRAATAMVHRDIHALQSSDRGRTFTARKIDAWEIGACPMSSMTIVPGVETTYAWEHDGNVAFRGNDGRSIEPAGPDPQDANARRKHPRVALGKGGTVLMAWATGTGWNKGGAVGWQLFANGVPVEKIEARDGLPVWSFPAVAAVGDRFVLLY